MVIPYMIIVLCLVSPSTQFNGFDIGQGILNARQGRFNVGPDGLGLGGTRVYDNAETAAVIQTAPSYPAQVSIIDDSNIGIRDAGNSGFGGFLTTALPLLLLLGAIGGGTTPKASPVSPAPVIPPVSKCPVCPTVVPRTCPPTREQCNPKAACPAGFSVVANASPNKCYLVGEAEVQDYGAASVFCASRGGSLFEHESLTELEAVRTLISDTASPYYIGFIDIGNTANDPVGIHTARGLPDNTGHAVNPAFDAGKLDCVSVKKTGEYSAVEYCKGPARVLCEARLDKVNCVCP